MAVSDVVQSTAPVPPGGGLSEIVANPPAEPPPRKRRTIGEATAELDSGDSAELRAVLRTLTDGIQVFDARGVMVSRNQAAARIFAVHEADPTTTGILQKWELLHEDGSPLQIADGPLATTMRAGTATDGFVVGLRDRVDGGVRWLSVSTTPILDEHAGISGYVSCSRDLTERMETIRALRVLTAAARTLSSSLVPDEVIAALTEAASELCSSPGERPRRAVLMCIEGELMVMAGLTDPTHLAVYADPAVPIAENPYAVKVMATGETLITGFSPEDFGPASSDVIRAAGVRNAAMIPMHRGTTIFAILAVSGRQSAMISADILTHLETLAALGALAIGNAEAHQRTTLASRTDPLTQLGNRRALEERFAHIPRCPFAILAIDVDHLKHVNDTEGHEGGDRLLAGIAGAMAAEIRPSDVLVRTGGDEFVALLVNCGSIGAHEAAARLTAAVAGLTFPSGSPSVSIGHASGEPGEAPEAVLAKADAELYRAKDRR
jgi:diguanylate cyclase (GGDEF)-like protein